MAKPFIEVACAQEGKGGERVAGDTFVSQKDPATGRVCGALSDGLGSGIKASVLSTLTATMALKGVADGTPLARTAEIIMRTLPVCRERKISYATFSIADISAQGKVRLVEYGSPPFLLLRGGKATEVGRREIVAERAGKAMPDSLTTLRMASSEFQAELFDRIVCFSDGVTQAGMGGRALPFGWGRTGASTRLEEILSEDPGISARALAARIVQEALKRDGYAAKDDISCAVFYFREPRRLLVLTGPPFERSRDAEAARLVAAFPGRKVISGGTTATLVARELGRKVVMDLRRLDRDTPPGASIEGIDLVTEGIITLGQVAAALEGGDRLAASCGGPAERMAELLLDSDAVRFVVGTRINEAHQDPSMPGELEIRRNVVRRIARTLEEKYLKDVAVELM